jgi:hypothetical protein
MFEAKLLMDMLMMVNTREGQHDEYYWCERLMQAGFTNYKIMKKLELDQSSRSTCKMLCFKDIFT